MPAPEGLYHEVCQRVTRSWPTAGRNHPALRRLALLTTGIIAAESTVLAQVTAEVWALGVTATEPASIARRRGPSCALGSGELRSRRTQPYSQHPISCLAETR